MNVLIRYVRQGPDGVPEYQDTEVATEAVTIGSAADRNIQLIGSEVAAKHAYITGSGAALKISCRRGSKARINDRDVSGGSLKIGDRILIGGHQLRLINPPAGFAVAIEVQLNTAADASQFETAFTTDLDQTWLSKRSAAWILAILTLLGTLVIPLGSVFVHRQGKSLPAIVPEDTFWTAGPLTPPHETAAGTKCNACHQELFIHVKDSACLECHKSVIDHVAKKDLALTKLGPAQRCAQSHLEHDGGASLLAAREDKLCIDCHADSKASFGSLKVEPASGFAKDQHPAFFVTLQKPVGPADGGGMPGWVTVKEPVASAHEESNLKYSHAQHLDASKVSRGGEGLTCKDCHVLEPNGEHFVPATMAKSCASGGCHELTFDAHNPTRQLAHGKPLEAMLEIADYFARKFSDPTLVMPKIERPRRLPGQEDREAEVPPDTCTGPSYLCAIRRSKAEIENQFAGRGCVSCHVVTDNHADNVLDRFQVMPVHLTRDYFSEVRFSHKAHAIQKDLTGDAACLSCHAARTSKQSTDVLIPDIAKCLECHGDRHVNLKDRVTVECVSCHTYHPVAIIQANLKGQ